jgi:hypothetical protein
MPAPSIQGRSTSRLRAVWSDVVEVRPLWALIEHACGKPWCRTCFEALVAAFCPPCRGFGVLRGSSDPLVEPPAVARGERTGGMDALRVWWPWLLRFGSEPRPAGPLTGVVGASSSPLAAACDASTLTAPATASCQSTASASSRKASSLDRLLSDERADQLTQKQNCKPECSSAVLLALRVQCSAAGLSKLCELLYASEIRCLMLSTMA